MAEYKVFIPTSGIGSRLGELTKYTNKSLVRIGKKPAISYIIENYPQDTEFVISIGHYGDHIKQFLSLAYPDKNITYVNVDFYDGPNSSLLYSISKVKEHLKCPFIFHACDTIVDKFSINNIHSNWVGGYSASKNPEYRSFNVAEKYVTKINDKGEMSYDFDYIGIFAIKDYDVFWNYVDLLVVNHKNSSSDYEVIREMLSNKIEFEYKIFNSWYDIGNVSALTKARENIQDKFHILDKNDESIFIFDDYVIKFFYDEKICSNRVQRAEALKNLVPNLLGSTKNFYKYEYTQGNLLASVINPKVMNDLLEWSKNNLWMQLEKEDNFYQTCNNFYFDKTKQRINKFLKDNNIIDEEDIINGIKIPKMSHLLNKIDIDLFCNVNPYKFHGDFILDNIIVNNKNFTLIDWRQDFAGNLSHGDIYYDLGKLNHNLIFNHDLVNKNNYIIKKIKNEVICDILVSKNLLDCKKELLLFCKNNSLDYNKVELMSSIIWINMSPLHIHPLDKFLYYFGKYNLYLNLKGYGHD
jgi:hypothetical protein